MIVIPIIATFMNLQLANRIFNFENKGENTNEQNSILKSNQNINWNDLILKLIKQGKIPQQSKRELEKVQNRGQLQECLKQRKKQLKVGLWDIMCMIIGLKKKQTQIIDRIEKILCKLNVVNILIKIQKIINKLKYVILNKEQLKQFNYIPLPLIPIDMFSKISKKS